MPCGEAAAAICLITVSVFTSAAQVSGSASPGNIEALIADAQRQPPSATACERVGVAYARREDFPKAAEWFEKTLAIEPNRLSARKNLGTVLWFAGRRDKAEKIFEDVVKRAPADPVPRLYLGLAAHSRGQFALAADHFEAAGTLASANPEVRPTAAEAYLQTAIHAIQIRGGIGFTWDDDTHLWFKRAKSSEILLGDATYHRELMMQRWAS